MGRAYDAFAQPTELRFEALRQACAGNARPAMFQPVDVIGAKGNSLDGRLAETIRLGKLPGVAWAWLRLGDAGQARAASMHAP
jgi:hypothetical protein